MDKLNNISDSFQLKKPICVLVGGQGGLGKAITPLLSKDYTVIDFSSKECDITDIQMVRATLRVFKPDIVVNLATVSYDGLLVDSTPTNIEKSIAVNVTGAYNLIKEVSIYWGERECKGRFIQISSVLSQKPVKGAGLYSASKAFTDNLIRVAALENAKHGSTWNSILLGYFEGGLCDKLPENIKEATLKNIPLRRFGKAEELVNTIKFLVDTEYCNGTVLKLDGGLL